MRISDWSSDVCSSDLKSTDEKLGHGCCSRLSLVIVGLVMKVCRSFARSPGQVKVKTYAEYTRPRPPPWPRTRSEEHTSELQSLMRISYAVFCLKQTTHGQTHRI